MPGDKYVFSIREYWRVCSGINEESKQRVVKFLNEVINTKDFPLTVLESTIESETAKILENSYRASILALMDEWSLFAERNGIDLIKVINAIKVRPSHNNMIFPGPGIGGYCLPKDGALGIWAYKNILGGKDNIFKFTSSAININDTRALHVAELTFRALKTMGKADHPTVAVLGASYKEDVGDTRNSGSEIIVRKLVELGADVRIHDPYVESWAELESQNGDSKSNYFYNQARLKNLRVSQNLDESLKGTDAVILAVRHKQYLALDPDNTVRQIGRPAAIVDCFGILDDNKVKRYLQLGCEVTGLGRGHIARIKNNLKSE
jgi:nucleotide sugar dehydrogenase